MQLLAQHSSSYIGDFGVRSKIWVVYDQITNSREPADRVHEVLDQHINYQIEKLPLIIMHSVNMLKTDDNRRLAVAAKKFLEDLHLLRDDKELGSIAYAVLELCAD